MIPIRKITRWILITAAAAIAAFGLSASALFWFVNSQSGNAWLLKQINALIPGELTASALHLYPLKGFLSLTHVTLKDPDGMDVVGFEGLSCQANWKALLKKELRISEIRLKRPWGRLYLKADGRLNLLEAVAVPSEKEKQEEKKQSSVGLPINLVVDYLHIEDGDVTFDYPKQELTLRAAGIEIESDGNLLAQEANLKFTLADLNVTAFKRQLPPTHIALSAALQHSKLSVNYLDLALGKSELGLSGKAEELFKLSGLDFKATLKADLAELANTFQLQGNYQGDAAISANLIGAVENPKVDLKAEFEKGVVANRRLDRINLAAQLANRMLTIQKARAELDQGTINLAGRLNLKSVFPHGFLKDPVNFDAVSFDVEVDQTAPEVGSWVPEVENLGGTLASHLKLSGQGASLKSLNARLDLRVHGDRLTAPGIIRPMKGNFNLNAEINKQTFQLKKLDGIIDGIQLKGSGRFNSKAKSVVAQLMLDAKDISQPLTLLGIKSAEGAVKLSFDLTGTLDSPQVAVMAESNRLAYGDVRIGTVKLSAELNDDHILQISSLKLENQGSEIDGSAKIRFLENWKGLDPTYHQAVELKLQGIEARHFYNQEIIRGRLDGQLTLSGLLENLQGKMVLEAHDLNTGKLRLGNLKTKVSLTDNLIKLNELSIQNKASRINGWGEIALLDQTFGKLIEDPQFKLTLNAASLQAENFTDRFKGFFSLATQLEGSLKHPRGTFVLHGKELETGVQKISAVDLSMKLDQDRVTVDPLKINLTKASDLLLVGWAQLDHTFSFTLNSDELNLSSVDAVKKVGTLQGVLNAYISGFGTLDNPVIDGSLQLEKIRVNDQHLDDFRLHIALHDHLVRVFGNLDFDLDASYHLLTKEITAEVDFFQSRLNPFLRIAGQTEMTGIISGVAKLKGNAENITDMVAQVDIEDLTLNYKKKSLLRAGRIKAGMAGRHILVEDTNIALLSKGDLTMAGSAYLNGPIDFSIDAHLPVADAAYFSDALVDPKGEIDLNAKVTGMLPRPNISADIILADISATIPANAQRIEKLNGKIRLDPKTISIENIKGKLDSGNFGLTGSIGHDFFKPNKVALEFSANALPVEVPDTLSLLLNSHIKISGDGEKASAKGQVVLLNGTYYKDVKIDLSLLQGIGKRTRSVSPPAKPIELPFFKKIDLDIDVSYREPLLVQNNMADMEIRPDLTIGGDLSRPVVSGRADVTNGTITFKKRTFTINKGVVDFVNPYKTEMTIDIESSATIREWTIILAIKGPLDNLKLSLSSSPLEENKDILSLLIFGKTSDEISNGKTQTKKSTNELLAGLIAETFGDELKGATGMDILEMETGTETRTDTETDTGTDTAKDVPSNRVKVTFGKHLSDRMTFKMSLESNDGEMAQRYMMEYKLLEHILASGYQDTSGVYGGELSFRIEFR